MATDNGDDDNNDDDDGTLGFARILIVMMMDLRWTPREIKIVAYATVPAWADCHMANNSTPPGVIWSIPY